MSVYDNKIVSRAILEQGVSPDPFPDLSKILMRCEQARREKEGTVPQGGVTRVSDRILRAIAAKMQIEVD